MNESEAKNEKPKEKRRFSQKHYDMLKRCSDKKDMNEWNEWRDENPNEEILLEGAKLSDAYLKGAYLNEAHLKKAELLLAHMENVHFMGADLEGAILRRALLEGALLRWTNLKDADLCWAHLGGADLSGANLEGANCSMTIIDGSTLIWLCRINRRTDFNRAGLTNARIDTGQRQILEYNIRRMNWENWYWGEMKRNHKVFERLETKRESRLRACRVVGRLVLTSPVRVFWWLSDYGLRTWRVIATFFGLATAFGVVYWLCPSCVMVNGVVGDIRGFWHALYFSVVTMTTLGFGDIAANPDSWGGQTLLMLQVILGYVLLGALVTRFAVLFTAGGPAGKFADEKGEKR